MATGQTDEIAGRLRTRSRCALLSLAWAAPLVACGPSIMLESDTDGTTATSSADTEVPITTASDGLADSADGTTTANGTTAASLTSPGLDDGTDDGPAQTSGTDPTVGRTDDGQTDDGQTDDGQTDDGTSSEDGASSSSDGPGLMLCQEPPQSQSCDAYSPKLDPFAALGLGCPDDPNGIALLTSSLVVEAEDAWAVATQFGNHTDPMGAPTWGPREGDSFVVLSNGGDVNPDGDGHLTFIDHTDDVTGDGVAKPAPAPIVWPAQVYDPATLQFEVDVPDDVSGFALDIAYFSEEFPEFVGTTFNDPFMVWVETETFSGNICGSVASESGVCTVTSLWPTPVGPGGAELQGTGFDNDAGLYWRTLRGPVEPGGTLQVTISVFDTGGAIGTSLALVDAFRWECVGCEPGNPLTPCGS